jgi:hypothetical protein
MANHRNGKGANWQSGEMAKGRNDKSAKWQKGEMSKRQNGNKMTKIVKTIKWQTKRK